MLRLRALKLTLEKRVVVPQLVVVTGWGGRGGGEEIKGEERRGEEK